MIKICEICGKEYNARGKKAINRKTCSRECKGKMMSNKVQCNCGYCGKEIYKTPSRIKMSKSNLVFCSNECVGKHNSIAQRQLIFKECVICGTKFETIKSRQNTHITCSNECQGKWQSKYRTGENSANYRGGGSEKQCEYCHQSFIVAHPSELKTRKFCSVECRQSHWKEHTIQSDEFIEAKKDGIKRYRAERVGETHPERLVREWLTKNNISFKQEQGFFRKYFADFYLYEHKAIIEVNGDFWHGNPKIYGDTKDKIPLYENQKEQIIKDENKKNDFIKFGFNYFVIWEDDIYKDIDKEMKTIINKLISPQRLHAGNLNSLEDEQGYDIV